MQTVIATYYAVCNVNGPISVELSAGSESAAITEFSLLDERAAIDGARTDAEDDLDIVDAADMSEDEFHHALLAAGAVHVRGLSPITNANAGTVRQLQDGWNLWRVDVEVDVQV